MPKPRTKQYILDEIRRTATANQGIPLGCRRFATVTGIRIHDWYGVYWTKWSDAVRAAGLEPNRLSTRLSDRYLLGQLVYLTRITGRVPTEGDLRLIPHRIRGFPSVRVFRRLGRHPERVARVLEYLWDKPDDAHVAALWQRVADAQRPRAGPTGDDRPASGIMLAGGSSMSSVVTPPPAALPRAVAYAPQPHRFTVDEYHRMIGTVLPEGPGYELLEGIVVRNMPQNPPHMTATTRIRKRIERLLPDGFTGRSQGPITLTDSEPEPDFAVARGSDDDYAGRHPGPAEIVLVVEAADSSRLSDRRYKQRVYGKAGLSEYWIVNIPDRQVEVYTGPQPAADPPVYATVTVYRDSQSVPLPTGGAVPVADLLP